MTRTKKAARKTPKAEKSAKPSTSSSEPGSGSASASASANGSTAGPSAASLIDKAHTLLAQSNFDLAIQFLNRALEIDPENLEARELVGVGELEGGDAEVGREVSGVWCLVLGCVCVVFVMFCVGHGACSSLGSLRLVSKVIRDCRMHGRE
jgi:tetratricopeptide (TPR) repeat protein